MEILFISGSVHSKESPGSVLSRMIRLILASDIPVAFAKNFCVMPSSFMRFLINLAGLMHRLYNRGFALAVSMPKPVPLVIVYLCGLIAGGGLQVLILPNTMGNYTSIVLHRRHLLSWIRFWWIVTIHLRRKAHSLIKVVWRSSSCAVQRPADIGLASAANFSHLHPGVVGAFPPCQKDLCCVNSKCHCAAQGGSAWIVAFSLILFYVWLYM